MNDIIYNVLPAQGPTIWVPFLGIFPINSPLIGSFLGVFAAFVINHLYQSYRTSEDKKNYINIIRSEIELCIRILELHVVQLLPVDRWTSAVNSGALKLFQIDTELQSLSSNYYTIKICNDLIAKDSIGSTWEFLETVNESLPSEEIKRILRARKRLLGRLKELKDVDWLNPSNETAPGYNDDFRYGANNKR
jgi:hypothetical protein